MQKRFHNGEDLFPGSLLCSLLLFREHMFCQRTDGLLFYSGFGDSSVDSRQQPAHPR